MGAAMRENPKSMERWRHFRGGVYLIQCIAHHVDNQEPMVVYASLKTDQIWVRALSEFMEMMPAGIPRFERM
jgi:hypothetical protein